MVWTKPRNVSTKDIMIVGTVGQIRIDSRYCWTNPHRRFEIQGTG